MRSLIVVLTALAVACSLGALGSASVAARGALSLDPAVGPPTSLVKVKGSGFGAGEILALLFDGSRVGSDVASRTGKFNSRLTVPVSARPGEHVVEAIGPSSGVSARELFLVRTDWLQGCFDSGRSCFDPYETVLGPESVRRLAPAWRVAAGTDGSSSPVYAGGKLFVGTRTGLVGLDPSTGAIIINYRTEPVTTTPAVIRGFDPQPDPPGKVVFGTDDGVLQAVSTTGEPLWRVAVGARLTSPLVIQGFDEPNEKIVVGAGGTLYAFDGNGARSWATVLEGGDISKAAAVLVEPPEPDRLLVAAGNTLYALDASTGSVLWSTVTSGARLGAPAVGNPRFIGDPNAFVGDEVGSLFSVDPDSGQLLARFQARGPVSASPAIGDPNRAAPWIVAGDGGGNIYAFDEANALPPPVWQAALGGPVDGPPVLANGVVYVGTDPEIGDPNLFALDQASGRVLFEGVLPGGAASEPIVADGKLIVATRSGDVVGYQTPDT